MENLMDEYIVIQMIVESVRNNNNVLSNIVMYFCANSEDEAIGKFVNKTRNISSDKQKLEIHCYNLSALRGY